jgi:hypothetical protein
VPTVCNLSVRRRVNRQYKHNLSCTVHDHRRLYKRKLSVGILPRVEKYLLQMPHSSTSIPTDTVSVGILQRVEKYLLEMPQSPTSIPTDMYPTNPSAFHRELKNIYWKCHNHRRLYRRTKSIGILLRVEKYLLEIP